MIRTNNGGHVAASTKLDTRSTTYEQRCAIVAREQAVKEWRKKLPRKRKPEYMKPGPVTIIQGRYLPC